MRRVGIYCRISRDAKGLQLGVLRQEADCRDLCARRGWVVVYIYVDNDRSAYSGKRRPEYERMLADLQAGRIDAIVAWHPDRLHRSPKELERFIDLIEAARADIATVQGGDYDLTTASGRMTARIVGAVARHESEHKSERHQRKHAELAQAGRPSGGMRPYGYKADFVTIEPDEAAVIREIADRVLRGETLRAIARDLNARGLTTSSGGRWYSSHVGRMLKRPGLAGLREHHGEVLGKAAWEPILDEATWRRVYTLLKDPARSTYRPPRTYLLAGIAFCGVCGGKLYARGANYRKRGTEVVEVRGYGCINNNDFGPMAFHVACVAVPFEAFVVDVVLKAIPTRRFQEAMLSQRENPELAAEVGALERELDQVDGDYGEGRITRRSWLRIKPPLEARLQNLRQVEVEQRRGAILSRYAGVDLTAKWPTMPFAERHEFLRGVLEKVTLNPASLKGRNRFDPGRVSILWRA